MDKLEEILEFRQRRLAEAKRKTPLAQLERWAKTRLKPANFALAINQLERVTIIAEMKRKSPSAGVIREKYDVRSIAKAYKNGGAAALSVLTEPDFFGGELKDMETAGAASKLPVLRKDFIFDSYQIVEAKAHGAGAVLLIAGMVPGKRLKELAQTAREHGLDTLVEAFTLESLSDALETGSNIIGVNTRNLRTLEMDPSRVEEFLKEIPKDRLVVAESGIKTAEDIRRLIFMGVSAVLIGESLLKRPDLEQAVNEIVKAGIR